MTALLTGLGLGFSAGMSPGPLMSLVIMTTLARGFGAGLRIAVAPLLTDALVIAATLLVISTIPPWSTAALAFVGGLFVIYLGVEALRTSRHASLNRAAAATQPGQVELRKGAFANLLNPHPWLFWLTVGSPLLVSAWSQSAWEALAFLAGFYVLLVGSKIAVAGAIAGGRHWLNDRSYRFLLASSGALLVVFGLLLLREVVVPALQFAAPAL